MGQSVVPPVKFTVGLDVGSNSLGWAIVAEGSHAILAMGVRIFPEGVNRDKQGTEIPKNQARREARGARRQIARRALRKRVMRTALREAGLWPTDHAEEARLLTLDPYALRAKGLDDALSPHEFGRVLLHLAQRRGFLSNKKTDGGKAKKDSSATLEMIAQLDKDVAASGFRTLGEFLLHRSDQENVRGLRTSRSMFLKEFELLWQAQAKYHPKLLTEQLRYGVRGQQSYPLEPKPRKRHGGATLLQEVGFHGIVFFQRALYWPSSTIGRCELEKGEKRCEKADRLAQRFRLLNEINNLKIHPKKDDPRPLKPEERATLIKYLSGKKEATFDDLRKQLDLLKGDSFNLEIGGRKKLHGVPVDCLLAHKDMFGKAWFKRSEDERTAIVQCLLDKKNPVTPEKAVRDWGCTPEQARELADIDLASIVPGYLSYSRKAIIKLLPALEKGCLMMTRDGTPSALAEAGFLRPDQRPVTVKDTLPPPPSNILNPLVKQALYEVRKVVNAIIREYGKPTAIHVELLREVQGGSKQRAEDSLKMRLREAAREKAADAIREQGLSPSRESINRYLLWQEQGEHCLYSGNPISIRQLFSEDVQVDHILPYSKSLDDSLMNKVVVFSNENQWKGNRTVWEWVGDSDKAKYERIVQSAYGLAYEVRLRKLNKIKQKEVKLDDFLNRHLSDSAYISSQVRSYLECLHCDVLATKGQLTSELRHQWGLPQKSRDDHRHHAVDALMVACTNRSRLQALARVRGSRDEHGNREQLPLPWPSFRQDADEVIEAIIVSHRPVRDLSGSLHEETIYGPTFKPQRASIVPDEIRGHAKGWIEDAGQFVVRKTLDSLTASMIERIRDPQVKALVIERLQSFGIATGRKQRGADEVKISKDVWKEPLLMKRKDGKASPHAHVIKSVRVLVEDATIQPIRKGERTAYVKPGNTHHISIFELPPDAKGKAKRVMHAVTMLEATQRTRDKLPLIARQHPEYPEARFMFSLSWGETVWATIKGQEGLWVYRTAASTQGQIYFVFHTDARPESKKFKPAVNANTLDGQKVIVDPLGRICDAND